MSGSPVEIDRPALERELFVRDLFRRYDKALRKRNRTELATILASAGYPADTAARIADQLLVQTRKDAFSVTIPEFLALCAISVAELVFVERLAFGDTLLAPVFVLLAFLPLIVGLRAGALGFLVLAVFQNTMVLVAGKLLLASIRNRWSRTAAPPPARLPES